MQRKRRLKSCNFIVKNFISPGNHLLRSFKRFGRHSNRCVFTVLSRPTNCEIRWKPHLSNEAATVCVRYSNLLSFNKREQQNRFSFEKKGLGDSNKSECDSKDPAITAVHRRIYHSRLLPTRFRSVCVRVGVRFIFNQRTNKQEKKRGKNRAALLVCNDIDNKPSLSLS